MATVWILKPSRQLLGVKINEPSEIHRLAPKGYDFVLGDCEQRLIRKSPDEGVYMYFDTKLDDQHHMNATAARILMDSDLFEVAPCLTSDRGDGFVRDYLAGFPQGHVIIYKMRDNSIVDYPKFDFVCDWPRFFDPSLTPAMKLARERFADFTQAFAECDLMMKPKYAPTTRALIAHYLNQKPTLNPTQFDKILRVAAAAGLIKLIGEHEWKQLSVFPRNALSSKSDSTFKFVPSKPREQQ